MIGRNAVVRFSIAVALIAALFGCTKNANRQSRLQKSCSADVSPESVTGDKPNSVGFRIVVRNCPESSGSIHFHYKHIREGFKPENKSSMDWFSVHKQEWVQRTVISLLPEEEIVDVGVDQVVCTCNELQKK